jgi:hypothetical protein
MDAQDGGSDGDSPDDSDRYYETDPDSGRIVQKYSDEEFLDAVAELTTETYRPSTGDMADALDCDRKTVRLRLKELADEGRVKKLESGAGFSWMPVEGD